MLGAWRAIGSHILLLWDYYRKDAIMQQRTAGWTRRLLIISSSMLMVLASLLFGIVPETFASPARMKTGTTLLPPGTIVHAASCEQAPPQSAKDRATYSAAELARYGLPPRTPGEPFAK